MPFQRASEVVKKAFRSDAMETYNLAGRITTRLGFGGSLLGLSSDSEAGQLLRKAFDHGLRHFDVAPMYGYGRSEILLRQALGPNLREVTITTKYGLAPPQGGILRTSLRRLARSALAPFPGLLNRARNARPQAAEVDDPPLDASAAKASIENSLRELGVDTIDLFLLHEATPARLMDDRLLGVLQASVQQGKIRQFGVGSRRDRVVACERNAPAFCKVTQYEWSVFSPEQVGNVNVGVRHGGIGSANADFIPWLHGDRIRCERWSREVGLDLSLKPNIYRLLLKASLTINADCIVLFSTRHLDKIGENVKTFEDNALTAPAKIFHQLVQQEYLPHIKLK